MDLLATEVSKPAVQSWIVKPSNKLNLPTQEPVPLHAFDLFMPPIRTPALMLYRSAHSRKPTLGSFDEQLVSIIEKLKSSLADALELYPPVAGSIRPIDAEDSSSDLTIFCDGTGAKFVVQQDARPYDEHVLTMVEISPRVFVSDEELAQETLFAVRVTQFSCGTLAIVAAIHHYIADLGSFTDFLSTWTKLSRGESIDMAVDVPQSWLRDPQKYVQASPELPVPQLMPGILVLPPISPDSRMAPFPVARVGQGWFIDDDSLALLKADCAPVADGAWISSIDALTALVWGAMARARHSLMPIKSVDEWCPEGFQSISIAVDGRDRLGAGKYFGNLNFSPGLAVSLEQLLDSNISSTAKVALAIRKALLDQLTPSALATRITYMEAQKPLLKPFVTQRLTAGGDIRSSSWARFDSTKMDFGLSAADLTPVHNLLSSRSVIPVGMLAIFRAEGGLVAVTFVEAEAEERMKTDVLLSKYTKLR